MRYDADARCRKRDIEDFVVDLLERIEVLEKRLGIKRSAPIDPHTIPSKPVPDSWEGRV